MLEKFWEINIVNNTIYIVLAVIVGAILFRKYVSKLIATFFYNIIKKAGHPINKNAYYNLLIKPLQQFVLWLTIILALDKLTLPLSFENTKIAANITVQQLLHFISTAVIIYVFCRFLLSIIEYIATVLEGRANKTESQSDNQLIVFFKDFFKVILIIIGILLLLKYALKQDIGNLITGLSIVGAAIALATKESLENLIASFIIFFDKPFTTGDELKVQNVSGVVERIGLRSTRIRTGDKTYVTVPNKQMVDSIVDNLSERTKRRAVIQLEVSTSSTATQIQQFKQTVLAALEKNKQLIDYQVHFNDFVKNAIQLKIEIFTPASFTYDEFVAQKEQTNFLILQLLAQHNIEITDKSI
jgi:MscS family membrane protein